MSNQQETLFVDSADSQLHVDELNDIITSTPKWLIRNGIAIFLMVIISVIGISLFIQYPDTTNARLVIRTNDGSASIASVRTGEISEILVKNGQRVKAGQELAYMKSTADTRQVIVLGAKIHMIQGCLLNGKKQPVDIFNSVNGDLLGELLPDYQSFYLSYKANLSFIQHGNWERLGGFVQELNKMMNIITEWKQKNIVTSSVNGSVLFKGALHPLQAVDQCEELFYINAGSGEPFGEVQIPKENLNNLKIGQKVLITITNEQTIKYPVMGKIESFSSRPLNNGNCLAIVSFHFHNNNLISPFGFQTGMSANAEIITQNQSFFSRVIKDMFKKNNYKL